MLPFRFPDLALEVLQLVLQVAYLPLDRLDAVCGGVLCDSRGGYQRGAECHQRAAAAVRLVPHLPIPLPTTMAGNS
jgi:hypothetical protein